MIPLRDRNPTYHRAVVTAALIVASVVIFVFVQPRSGTDIVELPGGGQAAIDSEIRFTFEYAAIPCEITEQRSLDVEEISLYLNYGVDGCRDTSGSPLFPDKQVWLAVLTSMFLHGNLIHVGGNMLFLWIFGNNIEDKVGPVRYLIFYLMAGVAAMVAHIGIQPDSAVPVIGASGAVAGVMGAYLVWFPMAQVRTLVVFLLRDIPAWLVLGGWFITQFFVTPESGIAWAAHVGGFVFGAAVGGLIRAVPAVRAVAWRQPWRGLAVGPWDSTGSMRSPRY